MTSSSSFLQPWLQKSFTLFDKEVRGDKMRWRFWFQGPQQMRSRMEQRIKVWDNQGCLPEPWLYNQWRWWASQDFMCDVELVTYSPYFSTISPLHRKLQVVNFQRCECAFTYEWNCSLPPPPITDSPSAPPIPTSSLSSSLACSLDASPCMPAVALYYCTFQDTIL